MNKDWIDAVRERCLSDEVVPSPEGWSRIGQRIRRATAMRRGALAVAVLVPAAALFLWAPWHRPSFPNVPIATNDVPSVLDDTPVLPKEELVTPKVIPVSSHPVSFVPSESAETSVFRDSSSVIQEAPSDLVSELSVVPGEAKESSAFIIDPSESFSEPVSQHRHPFSIGLKAGSGTARRTDDVALQSAPYMAGLAYLNSYLNTMATAPKVRSNFSNTVGYGAEANQFFPESSTDRYRHDLPVSLGFTARMEINDWAGIESGIEYTYLHSSVKSVAGRLDQRLHFIGIPVRLDARLLSRGGFDLYAGVGAKAEKCIAASFGNVTCEEKRIQWSAEAFAGIQYGLWNHTHLFFQPEVSFYFTGTDLLTYRTENPLTVGLQAGLRFDL